MSAAQQPQAQAGGAATARSRILVVDDEPNILAALQRSLDDRFDVLTATSARQGLGHLGRDASIAVVVSDMRMPETDGATFLAEVRERWPSVIRILLTGQADVASAIAAVNKGAVFRFLSKPCPREALVEVLDAAVALQRTTQAERRLLETTLMASVNTLVEMLALSAPAAFQRTSVVRTCVRRAVRLLKWSDAWMYEIAAALSQIGCVAAAALPDQTDAGAHEPAAETAARLIGAIPRLELAAQIVRYQEREPPADAPEEVQRGAALLRAALTLEALLSQGTPREKIGALLAKTLPPLPAAVTAAVATFRAEYCEQRTAMIKELVPGYVLDQDVTTTTGLLVLSRNHELTEAAISALRRLHEAGAIAEPLRLRVATRPS